MVDPGISEDLVLGLLADAGETCVSGEVLSRKLGIRPAEVYRQVERLRSQGYRIDAVGRRGYRLVEVPDRLTAREIEPFLTTHDLGRGITHVESVDSTNALAAELAREGAFQGDVVVAEHQQAGRGRRGRSWVSPPGKNLYCSVVLRPPVPPARAPELTFVAAVAVTQTLREAFNVPADIKWPNDIEISGRKIAGILTELETVEDRVDFVILGIGVNINMEEDDLPEELRPRSTSVLLELGQTVDRPLLTAALLSRLEDWYDRWLEDGFEPVRETWRIFSSTLGNEVRVVLVDGEQGFDGVAEGVDPTGALLVRSADGRTRKVHAGEIQHLRRL